MRARFVIAAAILVGAALAFRLVRADSVAPLTPAAAPERPEGTWRSGATGAPFASVPPPQADPAPAPPAPEARGRFALGGHAAASGHMTVSAVSFATRHEEPVAPEAIRLAIETSENVPGGGLVVLGDPGFAPDAEGFTLMLAAAAPGRFAASGWYELVGQAERTSDARVRPTEGCSR